MAYPSSLDSLRTDLTGADDAAAVDHAGLHNDANAAINAVEAELGTNPSGAAATVKDRLDAIDADARWTDQRTPTDGSVTNAKVAPNAAISPSKIAGTAVVDNDSRLTNARTPTAHKASHATDGGDALTPADIGAATAAQGAKADTAVQPTLIDAKGDLLVGAADNVLMRLPAAADGRMLTTDGSQSAGVRWALPTTRVGTGSPLGIVTPDFVGQEWVDTAVTMGAAKWRATGTTASSWVVSDGDTGWLPVTVTGLDPSNTGTMAIRRTVAGMQWRFSGVTLLAGTGYLTLLATLPAGFAPDPLGSMFDIATSGANTVERLAASPLRWFSSSNVYTWAGSQTRPTAVLYGTSPVLPCPAPWPTAAPV